MRRGGGGGGRYPNVPAHAAEIEREADAAVDEFSARRAQITDFDPKLILRIELGSRVTEEEFARAGLTVLDSTVRDASVVFAGDEELHAFRMRLEEYRRGRRVRPDTGEEGSARYESFFDAIDALRVVRPEDRISPRLREQLVTGDGLYFDVECWFLPDRDKLSSWLQEIRDRLEAQGGRWLDQFVSIRAGVAVARCFGAADAVRAVAELDQVAVVDRAPQPRLTRADLAALQDIEDLEVVAPPAEAPVVGIIDSGLRAGHPILEPAAAEATALHDEFGGQGEDEAGHGTQVAGITLYGDVEAAARRGRFEAPFWLASVRVLDAEARVPEAASFLRVISDAVQHLAETWETKVINLSIGDSDSPYAGGKSTPLAAALDTLARRFDLVIIVSAGNLTLADLQPHEQTASDYPTYLAADGCELLDPAQAALALTVGSVSANDGIAPGSIGTSVDVTAMAPANGPAPFTRHGPGAQRALKPELTSDGGNLAYDRSIHRVRPDLGCSVITTSARYPVRLFEAENGTSLSAAGVAHLAGRLVREYPDLSANAVRALVLQGADHGLTAEVLADHYPEGEVEARTLELAGYGVAVWERVGVSQDNRVVMYAEDTLRPDNFHVYRVPMTASFMNVAGPHELTVSLAFDPPVRHRRFDYLAYRMDFLLVRGVDLADVYEMAGADIDSPAAGRLREYEAPMRPTRTDRGRGANQVGRLLLQQRPQQRWANDWHLVVRSINRWMDEEEGPQRYAVAVGLGVARATDLYAELETELRAEIEVQL
jgi:hypothetical protein